MAAIVCLAAAAASALPAETKPASVHSHPARLKPVHEAVAPMREAACGPARMDRVGGATGRRGVMHHTAKLAAAAALLVQGTTREGQAAAAPRALSDVVSKIPGYGMADLFFPSYFKGKWDCISELVDIQMPSGEELVPNLSEVNNLRRFLGSPETLLRYNQTYFSFRDQVIADRGINTRAARNALRFDGENKEWYMPLREREPITDVTWDPANPNFLSYTAPEGMRYEVLVTKRAFEKPNPNVFITSEVVRQTQTDMSQMQAPVVKQVKDQVKYRYIPGSDPPTIQAILISDVFLTPQDARLEDYIKAGNKPVTVYRTRILMTKAD